MNTRIDHLVIAAASLEQGAAYVKDRLGADMPFGGVHPKMGTHNCLMRLGNDIFLEIISVNPDAVQPERPRWFALDDASVRQRIEKEPVLLAWVVNTPDIYKLMSGASFPMGIAEPVSRGNLNWFFSLPEDGRLFGGGMLPYAIQWQTEPHPSGNMADNGCELISLEIKHPCPEWLMSNLASIGAEELVSVSRQAQGKPPELTAVIKTPSGVIILK